MYLQYDIVSNYTYFLMKASRRLQVKCIVLALHPLQFTLYTRASPPLMK